MTVATTESNEMGAFDQNDEQIVRYLGLNPNSPADRAMVAVCRQYDFDPVLKHVVVIPKGGVYITRDGLLHAAHRSGQFDGMVVEQDPTFDRDAGEWVAKVSVYRKDMTHPFTYPGRYPSSGSNKAYAQEMALKAAEAHALRRAFDISGMPTLDEQRPEPRTQSQRGLGAALSQTSPASTSASPQSPQQGEQVGAGEPPPSNQADPPAQEPEAEVMLDPKSRLGRHLFAAMGNAGITQKEDRLALCSDVTGREITSSAQLTEAEARLVIKEIVGDEPPADNQTTEENA